MPHRLEEGINRIVDSMLSDYQNGRTIDEVHSFDRPDRNVIIDIINQLKSIVFPGYFRNSPYKVYTIRNNVTMLLEDVTYNLIRQITLVLRYLPEYRDEETEVRELRAEQIVFAFFEKIPKIREYIETDVQAAFDGDPAAFNKEEIIFSYPGL